MADLTPEIIGSSGTTLPEIAGLTILMFGINYAPEPTGIAPYNTRIAEHLVAMGACVTVVTGFPHYPSWHIADRFRRTFVLRERRNGVNILRVRHTVPRTMTAGRRALYEATFQTHSAVRTIRMRPDLVLAVSPALGGAVTAALVARRARVPLVTIVQDLMAKATDESGISGWKGATRLSAAVESRTLGASDRILIVSEEFRSPVESYGVDSSRIGLLRNWVHISPSHMSRDDARDRLGWNKGEFLAVHTGNMGHKQDLGNLINTGRLLVDESAVRILLIGDGSQRASLESAAAGADRVSFADPVEEDLYPLVLAAADVLLVNERSSVSDMSLPSKLTSYMAAGRPIVAAVTEGGATWRELQRAGSAVLVPPGSPARLRDAIVWLRANPEIGDRLRLAGRDFCSRQLTAEASLNKLVRELGEQVGRIAPA